MLGTKLDEPLTSDFGSIQLSLCTIVFTQSIQCKGVFYLIVAAFQSNFAEGLHFNVFHIGGGSHGESTYSLSKIEYNDRDKTGSIKV